MNTLSSPHLPLDPITISDDYGLAEAAGAWASPPHPPGPQDLSGTAGRTEQRTPPPNPLGQQYLLGTTGRQELHSESRRTDNCYYAAAPLDRQTYNAGYIHMEIEAPRPWLAMTPTSTAGDRTRSAEVCYTAGLDNAGCATRLRQQAKEERRRPDTSWNRLKEDTTAARSVTGRD